MNPREFFFAVSNMREAQRSYIKTRDSRTLRASIAAEREIDAEIERVKALLAAAANNTESITE